MATSVSRPTPVVRPNPFEWSEFVHQVDAAGSESLPPIALAGAVTGVVLSPQSRAGLVRFGAKSMLVRLILVLFP